MHRHDDTVNQFSICILHIAVYVVKQKVNSIFTADELIQTNGRERTLWILRTPHCTIKATLSTVWINEEKKWNLQFSCFVLFFFLLQFFTDTILICLYCFIYGSIFSHPTAIATCFLCKSMVFSSHMNSYSCVLGNKKNKKPPRKLFA